MNSKLTQDLFSSLIQRPILTDQLLQRPPFKFIHDIVKETVRTTGYLKKLFTDEDLNASNVSASKERKIAFLQKLLDALNIDGTLGNVKPAKIVAGKDAELTNLLLQKFATEAANHLKNAKNVSSKKKAASKSSAITNEPTEKSLKEGNKSTTALKPKSKKESSELKSEKFQNTQSKSKTIPTKRDKSKNLKNEKFVKTPSKKQSKVIEEDFATTKINECNGDVDSQKLYHNNIIPSRHSLPERDSSGGTSKGGDDSGIAESAESEHSERLKYQHRTPSPNYEQRYIMKESNKIDIDLPSSSTLVATNRPQTSLGRPKTAAARSAPPKIKKSKIADIDNSEVNVQPVATNSTLILEGEGISTHDIDLFLVDKDEDAITNVTNIDTLNYGNEHGFLVNKIIQNTRELHDYDSNNITNDPDIYDQKTIKPEIEKVQEALQRTTRNIQSLIQTVEVLTDDLDIMFREVNESQKIIKISIKMEQDCSQVSSEKTFALMTALRNLNQEIEAMRKQIVSAVSNVIENDKKIEALLRQE